VVQLLLVVNVVFTGLVMLHNLDLLQKRFVADLLSLCNLVCGTLAMWAASRGAFEVSLLWLLLGAGFDGFDGAAARRWGGTRWGVYSDDLADAVNFACAPAAVLWFGVAGAEGVALALCFALFTIGRLVFFTLNKGAADPRYFNGVPSTVGAIMAVTSVILFRQQAALVGLFVGIACAQMVAFDTLHRHVGRALASQPKLLLASPLSLALLAALAAVFGPRGPVTLLLAVSIGYGLAPCVLRFRRAGRAWRRRHADDAGALSGAA
jgi:CDP-diacylglycerol--serine O-phosphatidyltransferase